MNFKGFFSGKLLQFIAALTGSLGILCSEMHFGWTSPSLPILENGNHTVQLTEEMGSWLAVTIFPGLVCGAVMANYLADLLGRKTVILISSVPLFGSWLMLGFAKCSYVMFAARFIGGIGGGLSFTVVPMYLGEITEPCLRGRLSSLCPIFVVLGILLINIFGIYLGIDVAAFIASGIPVFMAFTFWWMPQSPIWLMGKDQKEKTLESLKRLRGSIGGSTEILRLNEEYKLKDKTETKNSLIDLLKNQIHRKALLIGLGLRTIQQLSGSSAITIYCKTIFLETESFLSADIVTTLYFTIQAVISIISSYLVDLCGRRPLFIISMIGSILTLFTTGIFTMLTINVDRYIIISLLLNVAFFSLGIRNIPLLVMSEIFHQDIKASALCFATIYYAIIGIVTTKVYQISVGIYGLAYPMFAFAGMSLVGLLVYCWYVPETKGKTLEDIQKLLKNA